MLRQPLKCLPSTQVNHCFIYILRKFEVQIFIILNGLTIKIKVNFVFFKVNFEFNTYPLSFME